MLNLIFYRPEGSEVKDGVPDLFIGLAPRTEVRTVIACQLDVYCAPAQRLLHATLRISSTSSPSVLEAKCRQEKGGIDGMYKPINPRG
jgi:hypothetical protein